MAIGIQKAFGRSSPKAMATAPARYRALVYVGAGCELRHGEALGLELGHIDFLRREINVVQQMTVTTGRSPFLGPVKTRTSRRTVELPNATADTLASHLEQHPATDVEITDETDRCQSRARTAKPVFTNNQSKAIHRASWSHDWQPAARAAGLPTRVGFHSLRHYFATLLIHSGASVKTVQMALGHSTPTVTLNAYVGCGRIRSTGHGRSSTRRSDRFQRWRWRRDLYPICTRTPRSPSRCWS